MVGMWVKGCVKRALCRWARMSVRIGDFTIIDVAKPNLGMTRAQSKGAAHSCCEAANDVITCIDLAIMLAGEFRPSRVRADIRIDLIGCRPNIRAEWCVLVCSRGLCIEVIVLVRTRGLWIEVIARV